MANAKSRNSDDLSTIRIILTKAAALHCGCGLQLYVASHQILPKCRRTLIGCSVSVRLCNRDRDSKRGSIKRRCPSSADFMRDGTSHNRLFEEVEPSAARPVLNNVSPLANHI